MSVLVFFCLVANVERDGLDAILAPLATVIYGAHLSFSFIFLTPYLLPQATTPAVLPTVPSSS